MFLLLLLTIICFLLLVRKLTRHLQDKKAAEDSLRKEEEPLVQYVGVRGDRYTFNPKENKEVNSIPKYQVNSVTGDFQSELSGPDPYSDQGYETGKISSKQPLSQQTAGFSEIMDYWAIDFKELTIIHPPIAQGGSSVVNKALYHDTVVAVKMFFVVAGEHPQNEIEREVNLLTRLHHPNIVLFMGACKDPLCIITEYAERGSLYEVVRKTPKALTPQMIRKLALDVLRGLIYIHTRKPSILHRDLKSMNVLITNDWIGKIADFGLSKAFLPQPSDSRSRVGTTRWLAPEVLRNNQYSFKSDAYSFGMVVWEMWAKELPYTGESFENRIEEAILSGERPEIGEDVPEMWADVIESCWADEPSSRPSLREVMVKIRNSSV